MSNDDFIDSLSDESDFIGKQYVPFDKDALIESLRKDKSKEDRPERKVRDAKTEVLSYANTSVHEILNSATDSGKYYAKVRINDHYELLDLDSKDAISWLKSSYYSQAQEFYGDEVYQNVLSLIKSTARFNERIQPTQVNKRIASDDTACYIDLATPDFKLVKISADELKIVNHGDNTPYFTRSKNQSRIPEPTFYTESNPLERFLKLVRMENDSIFPIHLIASFLSHIPTPIFFISGQEGSAKTTRSSLIKKVIDPSGENIRDQVGSFGRNADDWSVTFANNYLIGFDNVSHITEDQSDKLCKAVTGDNYPKRVNYTDAEEIVLKYQRKIILSGIGLSIEHSDLVRRIIHYSTSGISNQQRITLGNIINEYKSIQTELLGFICNTLQQAYRLYPQVSKEITELPDMADFAVWGECISQALGNEPKKFLADYESRRESTNEILNEGNCIISFLENMFSGTDSTEIVNQSGYWFGKLEQFATENGYDKKSRNYPKSSNKLRSWIERSKSLLDQAGYTVTFESKTTRKGFSKNSTLMIVKKAKQESLI